MHVVTKKRAAAPDKKSATAKETEPKMSEVDAAEYEIMNSVAGNDADAQGMGWDAMGWDEMRCARARM